MMKNLGNKSLLSFFIALSLLSLRFLSPSPLYASEFNKCHSLKTTENNIAKDYILLKKLQELNKYYEEALNMERKFISGANIGPIRDFMAEINRELLNLEGSKDQHATWLQYGLGIVIVSQIMYRLIKSGKYPPQFILINRVRTKYTFMAAMTIFSATIVWHYFQLQEIKENLFNLRPLYKKLSKMILLAEQIKNLNEHIEEKEILFKNLSVQLIEHGLAKREKGQLACL